jgi:hypothetical protein
MADSKSAWITSVGIIIAAMGYTPHLPEKKPSK